MLNGDFYSSVNAVINRANFASIMIDAAVIKMVGYQSYQNLISVESTLFFTSPHIEDSTTTTSASGNCPSHIHSIARERIAKCCLLLLWP